jgi:hypothetical protein
LLITVITVLVVSCSIELLLVACLLEVLVPRGVEIGDLVGDIVLELFEVGDWVAVVDVDTPHPVLAGVS